MKRLTRHILLWSCIVASTALSFAQNSKISPDLQSQLGSAGSVNVVVQYNQNSGGLLGVVDNLLNGLLNLISSLGGTVTQQFLNLPALIVTMPTSEIATLANNASVAYVSLDRAVQGTLDLTAA